MTPRNGTCYPKMAEAARDCWAQRSVEQRKANTANPRQARQAKSDARRLALQVDSIEQQADQLSDIQRQRLLDALAA